MAITFSKTEVAISVAHTLSTKLSQIGREPLGTFSSICRSPSLKKCAVAVTCLQAYPGPVWAVAGLRAEVDHIETQWFS